jgi:hypothetical protein
MSFKPAMVDLKALRAAIARSTILLRPVALAARLADWARTRHAPDVDTVVLAWIVSHVPADAQSRARRFDA